MVKLNKIYTRTGDDGTTGLVSGPRRQKDDLRVEAFGTVDEVNAFIGAARLHSTGMPRVDWVLARIQNDLFDLGGDLANPPQTAGEGQHLRITEKQVAWLESQIDTFQRQSRTADELRPAGRQRAVGRPACGARRGAAGRAAGRRADAGGTGNGRSRRLTYLNRLSDLLFVLARVANRNGAADVLWKPGANTGETPPE